MTSLLRTSRACSGTGSGLLAGSLRMMDSRLANQKRFASSCRLHIEIRIGVGTFWTPRIVNLRHMFMPFSVGMVAVCQYHLIISTDHDFHCLSKGNIPCLSRGSIRSRLKNCRCLDE
jgi:hypothetical protein